MAIFFVFSTFISIWTLTSAIVITPTDPLPPSLAGKVSFDPDGSLNLLEDSTYTVLRNPDTSFIFAVNVKPGANGRAEICADQNDESEGCQGFILEIKDRDITVSGANASTSFTMPEEEGRFYFGFYYFDYTEEIKWTIFIIDAAGGNRTKDDTNIQPFRAVSHTGDGSQFEFKVVNKITNVMLQAVGVDYFIPPEEKTTELPEFETWTPPISLSAMASVAISLCVVLAVIVIIEAVIIYKFSEYLVWPPTKLAKEAAAASVAAGSTSQNAAGTADPSPGNPKTPKQTERSDHPSTPQKSKTSKFAKIKKLLPFRKKATNQPP